MIKWIGQHIVSLIARFRDDVYLENLEEQTQDHVVGIDDDGKLYKQDRGTTDSFTVEDGDTTDVVISNGKHWKFVEGGNIDINWTDTSTGSSSDEYDLTFGVSSRPSFEVVELMSPYTIESRESVKIQVDSASTGNASHIFDFVNGAGDTIGTLDKDGNLSIKGELRTLSAGGKGDLGQFVVANIPNLPGTQITTGTVDKDRLPDATSSDKGVIPKATAAETTTGTDDTKAATPKGVKDHFDSRKVHELALATAALNMNSQKITGVTDPTAAQDAATKNYVDNITNKETLHISIVSASAANTQDYVGYGGHYNYNVGVGSLANNTTKNNNWASKWSQYRCLEDTTIKQAKAYVSTSANFNSQIRFFKTSPNLGGTSDLTLTHLFDLDFTGNASAAYVSEDTHTTDESLSAGDLLLISVKKGSATSGQMFAELSIRLEY